jgi:hypothetical protein
MRKRSLILFITIISSLAFGQTGKIITVDNADEFVDAIGPDRTIQLKGSTIYLSNVASSKRNTYFQFAEIWEGEHELVITGVSNMKIIGLGDKPVEINAKPEEGDVISFLNCSNIIIENVDAGHGPTKGGCDGGVFNFSNCKNITIDKSIMYGSGTFGIAAKDVEGLICKNSTIRGCSRSILVLENCNNSEFNNCDLTENETEYGNLINIENCIGIKFNNCDITRNITRLSGEDEWSQYSMFEILKSMNISLVDCIIKNNSCDYLANKPNSFEFSNSKMENNNFNLGNFKE